MRSSVPVDAVDVATYTVPTDQPESVGTLTWSSTTIVVAEVSAGGHTGLGYTYAHAAVGGLIADVLHGVVVGRDALQIGSCWDAMVAAVRNMGRPGLASYAIAAVDTALWDLKGRLLDVAVTTLLDATHDAVPVYGSGGFTSYSVGQLTDQLTGWVEQDIPRVKMKVGRDRAPIPSASPRPRGDRRRRRAVTRHLEYFWDHVRIERLLFDGVLEPRDGALSRMPPDRASARRSSGPTPNAMPCGDRKGDD